MSKEFIRHQHDINSPVTAWVSGYNGSIGLQCGYGLWVDLQLTDAQALQIIADLTQALHDVQDVRRPAEDEAAAAR